MFTGWREEFLRDMRPTVQNRDKVEQALPQLLTHAHSLSSVLSHSVSNDTVD